MTPGSGTLGRRSSWPAGPGVSASIPASNEGDTISPKFDSMMGKLVVTASRPRQRRRGPCAPRASSELESRRRAHAGSRLFEADLPRRRLHRRARPPGRRCRAPSGWSARTSTEAAGIRRHGGQPASVAAAPACRCPGRRPDRSPSRRPSSVEDEQPQRVKLTVPARHRRQPHRRVPAPVAPSDATPAVCAVQGLHQRGRQSRRGQATAAKSGVIATPMQAVVTRMQRGRRPAGGQGRPARRARIHEDGKLCVRAGQGRRHEILRWGPRRAWKPETLVTIDVTGASGNGKQSDGTAVGDTTEGGK